MEGVVPSPKTTQHYCQIIVQYVVDRLETESRCMKWFWWCAIETENDRRCINRLLNVRIYPWLANSSVLKGNAKYLGTFDFVKLSMFWKKFKVKCCTSIGNKWKRDLEYFHGNQYIVHKSLKSFWFVLFYECLLNADESKIIIKCNMVSYMYLCLTFGSTFEWKKVRPIPDISSNGRDIPNNIMCNGIVIDREYPTNQMGLPWFGVPDFNDYQWREPLHKRLTVRNLILKRSTKKDVDNSHASGEGSTPKKCRLRI